MASPEAVEQARNTDIVAVAEHLGLELETRGAATSGEGFGSDECSTCVRIRM